MLALQRFSGLTTLFRREARSRPAVRLGVVAGVRGRDDRVAAECAADGATYRVTDCLRRWSDVRYFVDLDAAACHAEACGGIVWERYTGPTGAVNWWSLTPQECAERAGARCSDMPPAYPV